MIPARTSVRGRVIQNTAPVLGVIASPPGLWGGILPRRQEEAIGQVQGTREKRARKPLQQNNNVAPENSYMREGQLRRHRKGVLK